MFQKSLRVICALIEKILVSPTGPKLFEEVTLQRKNSKTKYYFQKIFFGELHSAKTPKEGPFGFLSTFASIKSVCLVKTRTRTKAKNALEMLAERRLLTI